MKRGFLLKTFSSNKTSELLKAVKNEKGNTTPSVKNTDPNIEKKIDGIRCLQIIEKVASKLKTSSDEFGDIIEKLFVLDDLPGSFEKKKRQNDVMETVLSYMRDFDIDELLDITKLLDGVCKRKNLTNIMVDDSAIKRGLLIGRGGFGNVMRGVLTKPDGSSEIVAVICPIHPKYNEMIENGAMVMSQLNHDNIVRILAVNRSTPEIVIELMSLDNLFVAAQKIYFTNVELLKILEDTAAGMEYLAGKSYLHRDLACRNIYLNEKKQSKIGDFGVAVYVGDTDGTYLETLYDPHDVRICPETLSTMIFTTKSDVWALGVVIWELFYICEHSSSSMSRLEVLKVHSRREQYLRLCQSKRAMLPQTRRCPLTLYRFMSKEVLHKEPNKRPDFTTIKHEIKEIIAEERRLWIKQNYAHHSV